MCQPRMHQRKCLPCNILAHHSIINYTTNKEATQVTLIYGSREPFSKMIRRSLLNGFSKSMLRETKLQLIPESLSMPLSAAIGRYVNYNKISHAYMMRMRSLSANLETSVNNVLHKKRHML